MTPSYNNHNNNINGISLRIKFFVRREKSIITNIVCGVYCPQVGLGACSPRKFLKFRSSKVASGAPESWQQNDFKPLRVLQCSGTFQMINFFCYQLLKGYFCVFSSAHVRSLQLLRIRIAYTHVHMCTHNTCILHNIMRLPTPQH